jgi:GntR family transcriptional regulator
MVDRNKHIPLYVQLHDILIEKIKEGVWNVEAQIPTEKALMEEYNIGRVTVREALSMLVNEGYLYKKHGIGTFVAKKQTSLGFEPLISLTYSLHAKGVDPRNEVVAKDLIIPNKKFSNKLKWETQRPCLFLKRIRYAVNTPIAIEESYFSEEYKDVESKYDLKGSIAKIILEDMKLTIKKVEQVIIPRLATKEEQEILKIDEATQVLNLERWIYVEDQKEPIYYLNFVILGNIYSFTLESLY